MRSHRPQFPLTILLMLTLIPSASAGARRQTPKEHEICDRIVEQGFREWKIPNLSLIPGPSLDVRKYPYELPLNLIVYNHQGGLLSSRIDEEEIAYHMGQARKTYHQCGVEVTIGALRFLKGPKFLDELDRDPDESDFRTRVSEDERCLFKPTMLDKMVNVYFIEESVAGGGAFTGDIGRAEAIRNRYFPRLAGYKPENVTYEGIALIDDATRLGVGYIADKRYLVFAHEIGHIVTDSSPGQVGDKRNLMNHTSTAGNSLALTEDQCQVIRSSPFVHPREGTTVTTGAVQVTVTRD